ncbi:MAG: nickel pincer cofactor biosynthesis protein LarC [Desulfobulbaceae bacterium]|nr:nickel pincer cofactor biosynthesis protein LarC [Desulfobulbaceae bacterium]HIJ78487.1 nickel pincer cofactor biosynthesis protein LarC [Deltaproteobacteria bacterium]
MTNNHGQTAYIDCFSGISGDMFLAALLDAGLPERELRDQLKQLDLAGYELKLGTKKDHGIKATTLQVNSSDCHPHRSWPTIRLLIEESGLAPKVKKMALEIFTILAEAEAKVHDQPLAEVHFHEVGGIDSIIDIVGAAIGVCHLNLSAISCAPLPMPRGWVKCAHGKLPLPPPAVCEILKGVPSYGVELDQELITPTGAAIVKALADSFGPLPPMSFSAVGYGAGSHQLANNQPNLLRLIIGASQQTAEAQEVEVIETHLDDWPPEGFPYLCEQIFALGGLDVALIPIQMKKGRPGFLLRAISDPAHGLAVKKCILSETSAIGLRFRTEQRWTLPRKLGRIATRYGEVAVKMIETPTGNILTPEYEDCKRVALAQKIPLKEVYGAVGRAELSDFKENK